MLVLGFFYSSNLLAAATQQAAQPAKNPIASNKVNLSRPTLPELVAVVCYYVALVRFFRQSCGLLQVCWRKSLVLLEFMLIQSCYPECGDALSRELSHTMLLFRL